MFASRPVFAAILVATTVLATSGGAAAQAQAPRWPVVHGESPDHCIAAGPSDGQAQLKLFRMGESYAFLLVGPGLPHGQVEVPVTMTFDGQPTIHDRGLAADDGVAYFLGPDPLARDALGAGKVRLEVDGRGYSFALAGAVPALDDLARCVAQQPSVQ